uniref:Uncharacterized protein MANES_05G128400 n=1 Tax=Rhizophora mucronata TaxID=61149 RepID=A0A2P2MBU5_RHIMU
MEHLILKDGMHVSIEMFIYPGLQEDLHHLEQQEKNHVAAKLLIVQKQHCHTIIKKWARILSLWSLYTQVHLCIAHLRISVLQSGVMPISWLSPELPTVVIPLQSSFLPKYTMVKKKKSLYALSWKAMIVVSDISFSSFKALFSSEL